MYPITYQLYHVVSPIVSYIGWLIPSNYQIITNNAIINITFPWNAQVNLPFSQFSSVNMFFFSWNRNFSQWTCHFPRFSPVFPPWTPHLSHGKTAKRQDRRSSWRTLRVRGAAMVHGPGSAATELLDAAEGLQGPRKGLRVPWSQGIEKGWWYYPSERFIAC